jgi:pyruvate kinase
MRRTKIVCTIGPTTSSADMIARLLGAGMDVARLNFSHGTHEEHAKRIGLLREAARQADRPLGILQDLQGPKIRTGDLIGGQPVQLHAGERFDITTHEIAGTAARVSTTYGALPHDVRPGDRILLSDGLIELRVLDSTDDEVRTIVVFGGELREHQGINLPGVNVSAPALTEKDIADLAFGLAQGVDYVAISFVRRAADLHDIKGRIKAAGKNTPVVAKIEKPEALDDLPAILGATDAIMVARGDLGVEMPAEQVPVVQKQLIEAANSVGVPVITATQMLDSMIRNPRPTRAEASDVANAIIDGTDAVMLSGETANGMYPIEATEMMARIAEVAEASGRHGDKVAAPKLAIERQPSVSKAISAAACAIVGALPVRAIVAFTMSGRTALLISNMRPSVPILAFTPSEGVYNALNLAWGVTPIMCDYVERLDTLGDRVNEILMARGLARPGDSVVVAGGHPIAARGTTNFVKVLQISSSI